MMIIIITDLNDDDRSRSAVIICADKTWSRCLSNKMSLQAIVIAIMDWSDVIIHVIVTWL